MKLRGRISHSSIDKNINIYNEQNKLDENQALMSELNFLLIYLKYEKTNA